MKKTYNKIVLAYSGGLDTSVLIPWLKENYGVRSSQSAAMSDRAPSYGLEEKALKTGASKLYIEDLTEEFVNDYSFRRCRPAPLMSSICWAPASRVR